MRFFRSTNPMMGSLRNTTTSGFTDTPATIQTFSMKLLLLGAVLILTGSFSFYQIVNTGTLAGGIVLMIAAPIIAIISVFVAMRNPGIAMYFAFVYALMQGVFIGAISGLYEVIYGDGIVSTAMISTLGVFLAMGFLYRSGLIKVTDKFRRAMFTILLGLLISSFVLFIISLFGGLSTFSLGFLLLISAISTVVASLYLLIDFDNISMMIETGADRQYEWVMALSLMVTLVWLYIELLRLIAILSNRRK